MEKVKVSYVKRWDDTGTCYRKGFTITKKVFASLLGMLQAEEAREKEVYRKLWLGRPIKNRGTIQFVNLTQARFIANRLIKAGDVTISTKRALSDYNTYLTVI